jgi:hypothetical protein
VKTYTLTHLSDEFLRRELSDAAANEKQATAELLAHIAEFDFRKLYLPVAYPSMLAYCVGDLGLSEEAAKKRIRVARAGREIPEVFEVLASGRVHLSGLVVLVKHLSPGNASELLAAATHKSREEIERLVAERFPKLDVPAQVTSITAVVAAGHDGQRSPGNVDRHEMTAQGSPGNPDAHARIAPLSSQAFAVQFTRGREADERFRYAQDLLGHHVASKDIAEVYDLAMKALIEKLERTRFAATSRPGRKRRIAAGSRHIAAHVKRMVWQRDEGRCTFVSESGRRCEARRGLEFDHVKEYARGGEATVDGIRLRCRGHNQYTAERTFRGGFMQRKRALAAAERKANAGLTRATAQRETSATAELDPADEDVLRALRTLGYRAGESRRALELCANMSGASREDKLRHALAYFPQRCHRVAPA